MGRGKFRIYLGSAPGVGKTYAMLSEGHRRVERGTDAVVAFVEHHNRPRTEVMLHGLEQISRRELEYRGSAFTEMDVDAVLARRPAVALVDELAHSNVPGSRHAKRWQDVEELLQAAIDVVSTVNIQHLESLGDVVETITGVRQRETVPDEVVRRADQIELVDMSPQALRRRMAHGNIYKPDKVDAALSNYFRSSTTRPVGRPVSVSASALADRLELRVVDRGPGVPDEAKDRIFEPFQRHGDAPAGTGVGLGLAVARGFLEAMDGTLTAEDTPGGGLTMVLTLPIAADARPVAGELPADATT